MTHRRWNRFCDRPFKVGGVEVELCTLCIILLALVGTWMAVCLHSPSPTMWRLFSPFLHGSFMRCYVRHVRDLCGCGLSWLVAGWSTDGPSSLVMMAFWVLRSLLVFLFTVGCIPFRLGMSPGLFFSLVGFPIQGMEKRTQRE